MFLATNGGPHPADKLAAQVAQQIGGLIVIADNSASEDAKRARREKPRLLLDIADAIEEHHNDIMLFERGMLDKVGTERLSDEIEPDASTLAGAIEAVVVCAKDTLFEAAFRTDQFRAAVGSIIGSWFATAIDIERDWVAKGHTVDADGLAAVNPDHLHDCPHVLAWHARRAGKAA